MIGFKIRIFPNKEQVKLLHKSIGSYRYIYITGG